MSVFDGVMVRWRRLKSPESLERAWSGSIAKAAGYRLRDTIINRDLVKLIRNRGMWAFVDTTAKPPVVRYWCSHNVKPERLAAMLGHELGHTIGKPRRGHLAEEQRADDYGRVAVSVYKHLSRKKRRR